MKKIFIIGCLFFAGSLYSQPATHLTLDSCYELAKQNYPLIKQRDLIARTKDYSISNAAKGYLPQLNLVGQATYQSDVVKFPTLPVPGFSFPVLSKDQYKAGIEINQTIYDAGAIKYSKESQQVNADIQEQSLEVNLYSLKDRVSQLYFSILLLQEQVRQNELRKNDFQNALSKTEAAYTNGTAFKSNVDELKAEVLNADQNITEIKSNKKAYMNMLAIMINRNINDSSILDEPVNAPLSSTTINRPELKLYDSRKNNYDLQEKQLKTGYLPKVNAFAQGYYGRPTYNFIDNKFGLFGLAGISFKWPLYNLYTNKNNKIIFNLSKQNIDAEKETFLFNTKLTMTEETEAVIKYNELIKQDDDIILLRASVKNSANSQLENGVITSHDFITKVNDETQARLNLAMHKIQLLQAQYNFKNTSGN